ncbi:hypothetical protein T440DRAFT_507140 [Plenodomus tracheiphilus IPT5]|uniref:Uncharacterized protein n=1 Tax=Plenodomus tracheiphilus IPT5 TaxID=1408161 RepID=A0A6A7B8P6_9PLEO|nr:hypothetical protein T440DRAFT_507140 [Plenodomus tracheiphilus IPT5]
MDISHAVKAMPENNDLRYIKVRDSTLSNYEFNIVVKNLGSQTASFAGNFVQGNPGALTVYNWTGDLVSTKDDTIESTVIDLERPAAAEGSLEGLRTLSPFASVTTRTYKQGQDMAQTAGDALMFKIMMHALDQRTLENFLPNLQPLDSETTKILNDNIEYFHRGAVHIMAEQLKGAEKIRSQDWSKHIVYRYEQYMKMMASLKKPDKGDDPVAVYGWDRNNTAHMTALNQLQTQHKDVAMRCYQWGYQQTCPEWIPFLKTPTYWFKAYGALLMSPEYKDRWLTQLVDRPDIKGSISPTDEILMWGNKLSLLKANAPAEDQKELVVEHITEYLLGEAITKLAYAQVLDAQALKHLLQLIEDLKADPTATSIAEEFKKAQENQQEIRGDVMHALALFATMIADPNSGLCAELKKYWEKRLPKAQQTSLFTIEQVIQALEDQAFVRNIFEGNVLPAPEAAPWKTRFKESLNKENFFKGMKTLFQSVMHCAALGLSIMALVEGGDRLHAFEITQIALCMTAEVLNLTGMAARRLITSFIGKVKSWTRTINFFFDAAASGIASLGSRIVRSLAGNITKLVRLLGLIGCVFSIIASYWDIKRALDMGWRDGKALFIYSVTQMVLGILEAVVIAGEIICDIFFAGCAFLAWSGPACILIAVVGLIVAAIYFIFFAPDPYKDVKFFLDNEGKSYGSYDEGSTVPYVAPVKPKEDTDLEGVLKGDIPKPGG